VLGDYTGYLVAHRYGRKAFAMMHVHVPVWVEKLEAFVHKHPGQLYLLRVLWERRMCWPISCADSAAFPYSLSLL